MLCRYLDAEAICLHILIALRLLQGNFAVNFTSIGYQPRHLAVLLKAARLKAQRQAYLLTQ